MTRPTTGEQLIGVLIPPSVRRRPPPPSPLPTLPSASRPSASGVLFDVARLDSSGRLSSRGLVRALGWRPGQRLDVTAVGPCITVIASSTGRHTVTARGELSLPAPARALTGIGPDERVLVTADPPRGLLVVRPEAVVARLLDNLDDGLWGGGRAG